MQSGWLVLMLALLVCSSASADQNQHAGYEEVTTIGGPRSVSAQITEGDQILDALWQVGNWDEYDSWKGALDDQYGLSISTSLFMLYQRTSSSLTDQDDGAGYIFRWQGSWSGLAPGTDHAGRLQWRFESRRTMGGGQSPAALSEATGSASLAPGFGYSAEFDADLSVLNWGQTFAGGRFGLLAGRLDFAATQDPYHFQTFSRGFLNRAFLVNPTIGTTGVGALGIATKGFLTEKLWLGGGLYDANAESGHFDLDTVKEKEYLKHVEFGITPAFDRRGVDKLQVTWWQKDARESAGVSKGRGWALSATREFGNTMILFRYGNSDGGAGVSALEAAAVGVARQQVSGGILNAGFGWARVNDASTGTSRGIEKVLE